MCIKRCDIRDPTLVFSTEITCAVPIRRQDEGSSTLTLSMISIASPITISLIIVDTNC